jgi:hypothetical protein
MSLFQSKYRIESARLRQWDYSSPGYYFVTICTWDRGCLFGQIAGDEMQLNDFGRIVSDEWCKTGVQRSTIRLDEFIVMPNHVHGVIRILSTNHANHRVFLYGNPVFTITSSAITGNCLQSGNTSAIIPQIRTMTGT